MIAMFGIIELFILLVVLGGGALLLLLAIVAVASKRPGAAALVGGLLLLGLLLAIATPILYMGLGAPHIKTVQPDLVETGPLWTPSQPNASVEYAGGYTNVKWNVSPFGVLMVVGLLVAIVVGVLKRVSSNRQCGERGPWWPALLAVPLIGLFLWGSLRVQRETHHAPPIVALQQDYGRQHAEMARGNSATNAEIQQQITGMSMAELIDKVDAPRIALPPESPAPDAPPVATSSGDAVSAAGASEAADAAKPVAEAETAVENNAAIEEAESVEAASVSGSADDKQVESGGAIVDAKSAEADESKDRGRGRPGSRKERNAPIKESAAQPPAWVNVPPKRIGDTWREVVATDEYATVEECYKSADVYLLLATYNHLMQLNGTPEISDRSLPDLALQYGNTLANGRMIVSYGDVYDSRLGQLARANIGIDFVRREIAKDEYVDTVDRSVGPMKKLYTLLEFSPAVDRELRQRWDAYRRQERFAVVGLGAASVLGLLGMAWGLMKIDTVTKGYYTKRLFLGVPAAIIGGFLLLMLIDMAT